MHLFVYGTLLTVAEHPMGALLRQNATLLGAGWFHGRLYLIDDPEEPGNLYPGAVPSGYAEDTVHGEVWHLQDAATLIEAFDIYEACDASRPEPYEFLRRTIPVTRPDGSVIDAACYLYAWDTSRATPIPSGRFDKMSPDTR